MQERLFRHIGIDVALVNIFRQTGRAGQDGNVRRGHDGAEHGDEHEALESVREELDHERRNDVVGRREVRQDELAGHAEEHAGAGNDEHEHGRIDRAGAGGFGIPGRDAAGVAVHAREKRHDGRQAKREDRRPAPGAEVKITYRQIGDEVGAHLVQLRADQRHRQDDNAEQQQRHLHDVGIRHGEQAARRDIEHDDHGRMMWSGCYTKGKNMAHAVVFAEHTVKGMRDPWYIDEHSGAEYVKTWNDALRILDDGTPKKVVLYPNAECQVLDNSKQFYKQGK